MFDVTFSPASLQESTAIHSNLVFFFKMKALGIYSLKRNEGMDFEKQVVL